MDSENLNRTSYQIVEAAIAVHRVLRPGLLESVYRTCLTYELRERGLRVVAEQNLPVCYKHLVFDSAYRLDLLVDDSVIVELKSVEKVLPVHHAQLLSYLRLTDKQLGLLINFDVPRLVEGLRRIVNGRGLFPSRR